MVTKSEEFKLSDFCRPIPYIRGENEMVYKEKEGALQAPSSSMTKTKILNIPICDIQMDDEYDSYVSATFSSWPSYVKHVRKIGEEVDIASDFLLEDCDLTWLEEYNAKHSTDSLSTAALEACINLLERTNASSNTNVTVQQATKLLAERVFAPADGPKVNKLSVDVYKYWTGRREKLGKALCRRYWPVVTAGDTNPYQVFRVRDRERYRLRRQQKRNDTNAFKKMQTLKREFSKASVVLQLMLERERIAEASFKTQRQMFDLRVLQATNPSAARPADSLCAYTPQLLHIWGVQAQSEGTEALVGTDGAVMEVDEDEVMSTSNTALSTVASAAKKPKQTLPPNKKSTASASSAVHAGGPAPLLEKKKKSNKPKERMVLYTMTNGQMQVVESDEVKPACDLAMLSKSAALAMQSTLGFTQPSIFELDAVRSATVQAAAAAQAAAAVAAGAGAAGVAAEVQEAVQTKAIHDDVDGPRYVCQPRWPSFLTAAQHPQQAKPHVFQPRTCAEYLDALEYMHDSNLAPVLPTKFRVAARVGRGGRVVLDRIPVYGAEVEGLEDRAHPAIVPNPPLPVHPFVATTVYQCPVQLRGGLQPPPPPAPAAFSSPKTALLQGQTQRVLAPGAVPLAAQPSESSVNGDVAARGSDYTVAATGAGPDRRRRKELPDVPLSNKKLLMNLKRAGRTTSNTYLWASANVAQFQSIPAVLPAGRPQLTGEKRKKLQAILAENDSEDEKVTVLKHPRLDDIDRVQNSRTQSAELSLTKFTVSL